MTDKTDPNLVHVDIFGQTYTVRAGTDAGYVQKLAAYVDSQMAEVSRAAGAVDSVRIAVLAALNIADECFQLRAQEGEAERRALAKAEVLARALGAAVDESFAVAFSLRIPPGRPILTRVRSPALYVMDTEALNQRP